MKTAKKRKPGRPQALEERIQFQIRMTASEKSRFASAAKLTGGMELSPWMRMVCEREARKVLP